MQSVHPSQSLQSTHPVQFLRVLRLSSAFLIVPHRSIVATFKVEEHTTLTTELGYSEASETCRIGTGSPINLLRVWHGQQDDQRVFGSTQEAQR